VVLIATNVGALALMAGAAIVRFRGPLFELIDKMMKVMQFRKGDGQVGTEIRMYERGGTVAEFDSGKGADGWDEFEAKY